MSVMMIRFDATSIAPPAIPTAAAQARRRLRATPIPIEMVIEHVQDVVHEGVQPGAQLRLLHAHARQLAVAAVQDRLELLAGEAATIAA
jgi:gamma-glutamyl:cysteine ligase YbdK (ATP-grasp superfamily)